MLTRHKLHGFLVGSLVVVAVGCSGDSTGPQAAVPADVATLTYVRNGYVGSEIGPVGVMVRDAAGAPLPGVAVAFAVTAGGGTVASPDVTTDSSGAATTTWTLGTLAGTDNNTITVSVAGYAKAAPVLTVSALAGHPATIRVVSGNAQSGMVGTTLAAPLVVMVRDSFDNPASGAVVQWGVSLGGGWLDAYSSQVGADGTTSVRRTLGIAAGAAQTVASIGGVPARTASFDASTTPLASAFDVDFVYASPASPEVAAAFAAAAAQWRGVIVGDLPAESVTLTAGECSVDSPAVTGRTVDDVLILVRVAAIDGPGGRPGSGAPCRIRSSGFTTVVGVVTIDSADVAALTTDGRLDAVVAQQLGHALGFGTSWTLPTPPLLANASYPQPYFAGAAALAQFQRIGGSGHPEVHQAPGGLWEWIYWGDLMGTDWYPGVNPVLSPLTVAALEDMSYGVSYANAVWFPYCDSFC